MIDETPLDNPVLSSLTGPDARLAQWHGDAVRYDPAISVWAAARHEDAWDDVAALVGPGGTAVFAGPPSTPPAGWTEALRLPGYQMVGDAFDPREDAEVVPLGVEHVDAMVDLVDRTRPGPFTPRTYELGGYAGIIREGELIAMAGERMHPVGFTEISAVCTAPAFRGRGLATRVMRAVAVGIVERGDVPFLHVASANSGAVRLYETLGFRIRRLIDFVGCTSPG